MGFWCPLLVAIAVTLLVPASITAQVRSRPNPCVAPGTPSVEPTLKPVDEASRRPDFLEFRRRLQDAVARRDEVVVLASVHPNVRVSFGDSGGIQAFRKEVVNSRTEDFWGEFGAILRLGGRFRMGNAFDAPYTFSAWPSEYDSFECLAVIGTRVRVRAAPGLSSRILTALDFAIVRALLPDAPATPGWRRVELADGRTGYISSRYVRSPIDYRALFEFQDGRWWLMAYVAGD